MKDVYADMKSVCTCVYTVHIRYVCRYYLCVYLCVHILLIMRMCVHTLHIKYVFRYHVHVSVCACLFCAYFVYVCSYHNTLLSGYYRLYFMCVYVYIPDTQYAHTRERARKNTHIHECIRVCMRVLSVYARARAHTHTSLCVYLCVCKGVGAGRTRGAKS